MEDFNDQEEANGCGCFGVFRLKWRRKQDEDGRNLLEEKGEDDDEPWVIEKLRKMKEVSEVIAGPKWKTLIRKIKKKQKKRFQYDEHSYALNFNSRAQSDDDDQGLPPSFSARFAAPFASLPRQTDS